jgi:hypothetical protein
MYAFVARLPEYGAGTSNVHQDVQYGYALSLYTTRQGSDILSEFHRRHYVT